MTLHRLASGLLGLLATLVVAQGAEARLTRLVVEQREPFIGGMAFGATGPYERLIGTAHMEVDPRDRRNAIIVDLDKAPRNARGLVEFSTRFMIVKPVDMARSNQKIYYTTNNRGNDATLVAQTPAQAANIEFYLRQGYVIADAGWQGDVVPVPTRLQANLPIATHRNGEPITGPMRVEYSDRNLPVAGTFSVNLEGNAAFRSYETADTDTAHSTLTVRDSVNGPKTAIAPDRWAFGRCPTGQASLVPSTFDICYFDGFRADKLYELIYPAKNPIVMGLGHATTRDFASFLRYQTRDDAGTPNPIRPSRRDARIRRIYATGASQTAGYLRDFLYLGFNEDESRRKVFDGVIPTIGGTDRVFINVRFADPNIWSDQDDRHDFLQTSYPPFAYAVTTDPVTGLRDGVLKRPKTDPYVMQMDGGLEFWQLRASLNVHDADGRPVKTPKRVRLYFASSTGHGPTLSGLRINPAGITPPGSSFRCANPTQTGSTPETQRALVVAMDQWVDQGIEPPPSNYPRVENGTLVSVERYAAAFPDIPGFAVASVMNRLELLDFGPGFGHLGGILTIQPPRLGPTFEGLVPRADRDGLDIAGIRPLQIRVPLGTNTGWNVRVPAYRGPDLCGLSGSYAPFARTKAERLASGDPRRSLEERYGDHAGFVRAVARGAGQLVRARFLLPEDAQAFVAAAEESDVLR
jgi:hypothetical protein